MKAVKKGAFITSLTAFIVSVFFFAPVPSLAAEIGARAYASGNYNPSDTSWHQVQLNTENYDVSSNFNTGTYRFTAPSSGYYQINASMLGSFNSGNDHNLAIRVNGSDITYIGAGANYSYDTSLSFSDTYYLATNDYVELFFRNYLGYTGGSDKTYMSIFKITGDGGGGGGGVTSLTSATSCIALSGSTGAITLTNNCARTLTSANANMTLSASTGDIIATVVGGSAGVSSLIAGSNITLSATTGDITVSASATEGGGDTNVYVESATSGVVLSNGGTFDLVTVLAYLTALGVLAGGFYIGSRLS